MTCARREAGARKPASSTGSARPDPRPGRRRAGLSRLLPALALLLGALSPFAAAPAAADVLVSNIGQDRSTDPVVTLSGETSTVAQVFTTGSHGGGYDLKSIEAVITVSAALNSEEVAKVRAELWTGSNDIAFVGAKVANLRVPASIASATGAVIFTAPANVRLGANAQYRLFIYAIDGQSKLIVPTSNSLDLDPGATSGWSIAVRAERTSRVPGQGGLHGVLARPLLIRVNGSTSPHVAPTGLTVTSGDRKLDLAWTAPTGTVTSYDVHYTSSDTVANYAAAGSDAATGWVAVDRGTESDPPAVTQAIAELTGGTGYRVRVRAVDANGDGAWAFGAGTPNAAPDAPRNVRTTAGTAKLDLTWTAPPGAVTGYDVHYTASTTVAKAAEAGSDAATEWVDASHTGTTASHAVTGLTGSTDYRVRVRAVNANGNGAWAFGAGTPPGDNPSPPMNVRVTPSEGALVLTWRPPADWGKAGATTRSYRVEAKLDAAGAEFAQVGDLIDGFDSVSRQEIANPQFVYRPGDTQARILRVHARNYRLNLTTFMNETRVSSWVEVGPATPLAAAVAAPGAVTGLTATPAGDDELDIAWTAPSEAVTGYDVHVTRSTSVADDAAALSFGAQFSLSDGWFNWRGGYNDPSLRPSHTIDHLAFHTPHRVRVRARNSQGNGPWEVVTGTTVLDVRVAQWARPRVTVTETDADREVILDFAFSGALRSPATFSVSQTGGDAVEDADWSPGTCVTGFTGARSLTCAIVVKGDYQPESAKTIELALAVDAGNVAVGSGGTMTVTIEDDDGPPAAPTNLSITATDDRLDLIWPAPARAGTVTGYDVHYTSAPAAGAGSVDKNADASGSDPSAGWVDAGHTGTGAWHAIAGLAKGTAYRVRVRGVNAAGAGAWVHGTKAVPLTVPAAPRNLNVWSRDQTLDIGWLAPSDTGGSAVTGYDVHFTGNQDVGDDDPAQSGQSGGVTWAPRDHGTATTHTLPALSNGSNIRIRVRAKNAQGAGPWVHGRGMPTATPGPQLTGLSLAVGTTSIPLVPATFSGTRTVYTATVPHDATEVTVTPTWTGSGRSVTIESYAPDGTLLTNRNEASSGTSSTVNLASSGDTAVDVYIGDGSTNTRYKIILTRGPAPTVPPSVPRNVQAIPGDGKLTLTWQAPSSWGGLPAFSFHVEWKLSHEGDTAWNTAISEDGRFQIAPTAAGLVFTGAQNNAGGQAHTVANGTGYDLRIQAQSHPWGTRGEAIDGRALNSDWVTVSGTPAAQTVAPPSVPRNVAATPGDAKVTLTWQAPSSWGDWQGAGYAFEFRRSDQPDSSWAWDNDFPPGTTVTSYEWTGSKSDGGGAFTVTNGVAYDFRMRATSTGPPGQASAKSPWVAVYDSVPSTVPAAPTGLDVRQGDGLLDLTWTAPLGTVTGYDVHYTASSSAGRDADASGRDPAAGWVDARHPGTAASHRIAGLTKGTVYRVRVRGVGGAGAGAWAHGAQSVPNTVPGAVTHLNVAPGNARLDVSWLAPADDGGSALAGYDVHYTASTSVAGDAEAGTDAATQWVAVSRTETDPPAVTQRIASLANDTPYRVRVRASNALGSSAWLVASGTFTPTATTPPRLTGLTLAVGSATVDLTPAFAGAKTNYTATVPHDATDVTVTPTWTATGITAVGAVSGTMRPDGAIDFVSNENFNSSGDSADLGLVSSGDTFVRLTIWRGAERTAYVIIVSRAPEPPSAPRNVQATLGDGKLTLTWDPPRTWGALTADGFEVQWKLQSAGASAWSAVAAGDQTADIGATGAGFEFTGAQTDGSGNSHTVANGTTYSLRIRAVSAQSGSSVESDWVTVSDAPGAVTVAPPSVPQSVAVTPGDGKLTLTWAAPASWGDWTADSFDVLWKLSSDHDSGWSFPVAAGNFPEIEATDTSFVFTGVQLGGTAVTNGTAYDLRIRAASKSSGDEFRHSPWVAVYDSVPSALPAPGAVTGLGVTAGDGQLDLSWTAPSGTVTGYEVHYTSAPATGASAVANNAAAGTDAATGWKAVTRTEADPPAVSQAISGLDNGTPYRVRVRAVNGSSPGPWEFDTGTPSALPAPGAVTDLTVSASDSALLLRWTNPSGTLTGHDIHYTSALATGSNAVANDAAAVGTEAAGTDASTGWVAARRIDTSPPGSIGAIGGLDDGTAYRVRVRAKNGSTPGPWEFGAGTPDAAAATPPTVPRNVAAAPGDGKLTLTWQAPSSWGRWPASRFQVQWKLSSAGDSEWDRVRDGSGVFFYPVSTDTSFEFAGTQHDASNNAHTVANGTAYDLRIRAMTQQPGTDGGQASHFKESAWVAVTGKVPMVRPDRAPAVASTTAQTLWSATLTVRDGQTLNGQPVYRGCAGSGNVRGCMAHLTDHDFTFDGTGHEVTRVSVDNGGTLSFKVNRSLAGKKRRLVLHVGGVPFYGRDATFESGTTPANSGLLWSNAGLSWSTGGTVALRLVELPTVKLAVTPNPVAEGAPVSVTASLWRGSGASRAGSHIPAGTVQVPVIVTAGTAEARHDYGEGHPREDGTRRYLVSIHGANQVNFGTFNFPTHRDGDTDDETFTVAVDTASLSPSLVAGGTSSVTVTIEDLDEPADARPAVKLSVNPVRVREGGLVGVSVLMSSGLAGDVTIPVTVTRGTSEERDHGTVEDGAPGEGVLIPAGHCCRTALVHTHVDGDVDDETFTVALDEASLPASVRLDPDGPAEVEVTIVDDGRPGVVTERSVTATEGTDDHAVFTVRLGGTVPRTVSVDYATADATAAWTGSDGPAAAGADYTATSGTLTFAPGETVKTVSVPILDDAVDEGTEHFLLRFSNPRGAALSEAFRETVGLIENDDHLQAMWLARFGRTVASQVTEAVSDRLGAGLAPGAHVTLAGQRMDLSKADDAEALADTMTGLARAFGAGEAPAANDDPFARPGLSDTWNDPASTTTARSMTGREVLLGSAFHVAPANEGPGPGLAAWGRVAQARFDGEHEDDTGTTRVDGEVVTGVLGADADWGRLLAGVAVSLSEGEGKFDAPEVDTGRSGSIESTMTTVSPYARFKLTERVSAWGLAGWGTGDMTIRLDDGAMAPIRTDLSMQLGAIGARGELLTQDEAGGMDLALKADAFFVRTESEKAANSAETQADASRVRLVLEGGRRFALSGTATLRPSLELGVRHDGGDAETGAGLELGGGVAWTDTASGLSIEAKGRMLVAHADSGYEEWGASATARLDPGAGGRGLSFSLAPTIGAASSASQRLWGAHDARGLTPGGEFEASRGLTAEAGYGMALFGDRFTGTPNVGFGMSDGGARDYRLGWRLTSNVRGDPGFEVNLDALRRETANDDDAEHGVMLRSLIRW